MRRAIPILLALALGFFPAISAAKPESAGKPPVPVKKIQVDKRSEAERDSLWAAGHAYRQWIYEQNQLDAKSSMLDPKIKLVADGWVRTHPDRVYFYDDPAAAIYLAQQTKMPLVFYVFDHDCTECLYVLPDYYRNPAIVKGSLDFINVYVQLPLQMRDCDRFGIMPDGMTVQFVLPGLRSLRVLDSPDVPEILEYYQKILDYASELSEEDLMYTPPHILEKNPGGIH